MFKIQVEPRAQAACSSNWDSSLLMTAIIIFDFRWGHKHPQLQVWLLSCENQPIVCARVYYGIPLGKPLHKKNRDKSNILKHFLMFPEANKNTHLPNYSVVRPTCMSCSE